MKLNLQLNLLISISQQYIYVFGGCPENGRLNDLYRFDLATKTWEELPSHPAISARGGPGFSALGDKLVLFAGFNGNEMDDLWVFDEATKQWTQVESSGEAPLPRSVLGFVGLEQSDCLVCIHGERDPSAIGHAGAGKYHDDVWVLRLEKKGDGYQAHWVKAADESEAQDKPTSRGWIAASAYGKNQVVMFGGYDGEVRDNGLYVLTLNL
jgi:N-acetylneuraminic acid mutarotase